MTFPNMFANANPPRSYAAGSIIFAAGEPGDVMYVVHSGEVEVILGADVVETIGPEGILGEMAIIDNEPRSATARAKTDCHLHPITPKQFIFMVQETPLFAIRVMRVMSQRLRNTNRAQTS